MINVERVGNCSSQGLSDGRCTLLWVSLHGGLGFKSVVWLALMPTFGYHLYSVAKIVINVVAD